MAIENRIAKFLADAEAEKRQQRDQLERDAECVMVIIPHVAEIIAVARKENWDDAKLARMIACLVYRSMTNIVKHREEQRDGR